jgi:small nuclear ribonucleoprotein (snRNP)-like protein
MAISKEVSNRLRDVSRERGKEKHRKRRHDFSEEYMNKDVVIMLSTGEEVRGRLADATKYWFKVVVRNLNAKTELESIDVIYINKAYVAYVKPLP